MDSNNTSHWKTMQELKILGKACVSVVRRKEKNEEWLTCCEDNRYKFGGDYIYFNKNAFFILHANNTIPENSSYQIIFP